MYTLKTPTFFRSSSRPSSPLPTTAPQVRLEGEMTTDRASRPLTKLALTPFSRKSSPAPIVSPSSTLVQDGSYLESLGLKLSEAVTKALAQPNATVATANDVLNGRRPIPIGRGRTFGELITSELHACQGNVHLQRAILRLLHRPLTVLISNLSSLLLPLLSSPAFRSPPAPTTQTPSPNAVQAHAISVAVFAGEILDRLDELELDGNIDHRGDGLNNFREGFVSLISRVTNPLMNGIKGEMLSLLQGLENINPACIASVNTKTSGGVKTTSNQHPSIASLQALMPIYAKAVSRYTSFKCMQSSLAALLISVVWTGLVALSHRPAAPRSRTNSVSAASVVSSAGPFKKRLGTTTTPPPTPPTSRFTMKLPGSRPPSPLHAPVPTTAADARILYDLLTLLPKPTPTSTDNRIAREAVDEAFEALAALTALLGAIEGGEDVREDFDLDLLTEGLPVLIALPVLFRWSGHGESQVITTMLGVGDAEYRERCLTGFGRADECSSTVARKMLDSLSEKEGDDPKTKIVLKYLKSSVEN